MVTKQLGCVVAIITDRKTTAAAKPTDMQGSPQATTLRNCRNRLPHSNEVWQSSLRKGKEHQYSPAPPASTFWVLLISNSINTTASTLTSAEDSYPGNQSTANPATDSKPPAFQTITILVPALSVVSWSSNLTSTSHTRWILRNNGSLLTIHSDFRTPHIHRCNSPPTISASPQALSTI